MIQFNKQPGQKILELGCGNNPHPQSDVRVDVRPVPGVTDFTANFDEPLPIASGEFDSVYAQYVIEHVSWRKLKAFLAETLRVLKPGGTAIFVTANTVAQFQFIVDNPEGWDGKDDFDSFSCVMFGDQDYPDNAHKNFLDPKLAVRLMQDAGYENVLTQPWGERQTDMVIQGMRPKDSGVKAVHVKESDDISVIPTIEDVATVPTKSPFESEPAEKLFDRSYFNGGGKVGGYAREGIWDFPVHEITARHVLARNPKSVLELGAARGYIGKRIEDAGVEYLGLEVSKHCVMTRVAKNVKQQDLGETWSNNFSCQDFDLAFSCAVFEHIPEDKLPHILSELKRTTQRGLHGIDFGHKDDGFDRTHFTLRPRSWWRNLFDSHGLQSHEIVDKEELEKGEYPKGFFEGDGKLKLNVGCCATMFHWGWTNIDVLDMSQFAQVYRYNFLRHDARNGLPFATGSVDQIACIHMLEHLNYAEGLSLLREFRRVLKPDGALRIQVPDAGLLNTFYAAHNGKLADMCPSEYDLVDFDEVSEECARSSTAAGKLWSLLHSGHQSAYDAETLVAAMNAAGLQSSESSFRLIAISKNDAIRANFKQLHRETLDTHPALTLYVDGVADVH